MPGENRDDGVLEDTLLERIDCQGTRTCPDPRDCEHGRQRGKCAECELAEERAINERLVRENERLREACEAALPVLEALDISREAGDPEMALVGQLRAALKVTP